jgi:ABC-type glycerol-3-phosphate transport system substrate-binding protein
MFYRTDIFSRLNLKVPKTWNEFLENTAILQRNNMEAYIPYAKITAANTTDVGLGGLNLYATILMQNGGSVYNDDQSESLFTSSTSLHAFKYWTDMYTQYKIPTEMDFYNRFKVGTCPMGVTTYTTYTTLLQTAPEIRDRWSIALVPGTVRDDGAIDYTISGAGTGCAILNSSKNKESAWEFLKWWTSDDTQHRYNANVESVLGAVSRVTTANLEAFSKMGWDNEDLEILLEERNHIQEIPEIPGSYYLSRSVDQAYWAVINNTDTVKDAVTKWGKEANGEIKRKISEYQGEMQ